ncbi:unnamed protein product [Durusdinium trenchii]|uniref:Uncharacterized protein n=1 Tax=Durusdinium trenchii TaxID=1381693 RepID=A0ABP0SWN4_9DINO
MMMVQVVPVFVQVVPGAPMEPAEVAPAMEDVEQPFSGSPPGEGEGEESSSSETANGLVGTVWEGIWAIKTLLLGEEELLHSNWGVEDRKAMVIALRDWAMTSVWAIWNSAVQDRLQGSKNRQSQRLPRLLEKCAQLLRPARLG